MRAVRPASTRRHTETESVVRANTEVHGCTVYVASPAVRAVTDEEGNERDPYRRDRDRGAAVDR